MRGGLSQVILGRESFPVVTPVTALSRISYKHQLYVMSDKHAWFLRIKAAGQRISFVGSINHE